MFDGCGFRYFGDISASRVQSFLNALHAKDENKVETARAGVTAQKFNYYLAAVKAFCCWIVKDRRANTSPVAHLEPLNPRMDRRYERRALTEQELRKLIRAAAEGRELAG